MLEKTVDLETPARSAISCMSIGRRAVDLGLFILLLQIVRDETNSLVGNLRFGVWLRVPTSFNKNKIQS